MATDYVLFIHGVKTPSREVIEPIAHQFFDQIKSQLSNPARKLELIVPFWGGEMQDAKDHLRDGFLRSPTWKDVWYQDFRSNLILDFVGDAALYISRYKGARVVECLYKEGFSRLKTHEPGDRLHLLTHSWGTVILFDLLFARRWEDPQLDEDVPGVRSYIQDIRATLFGLPPNEKAGIRLASIHTMGSPIALFTLLNVGGKSGHDLTPKLKQLLGSLYELEKRPLMWKNYVHPGDPICYPLEGVMNLLLNEANRFVKVDDVITYSSFLGGLVSRPFRQTLLPMLGGGEAHQFYFKSKPVFNTIAKTIEQVGAR